MGKRHRSRTVTVEVDIDDALNGLEDEDVIEEAEARQLVCYRPSGQDDIEAIRSAILKRDWPVAIALFDRQFKAPNPSAKADYEAWKLSREKADAPSSQGSSDAHH